MATTCHIPLEWFKTLHCWVLKSTQSSVEFLPTTVASVYTARLAGEDANNGHPFGLFQNKAGAHKIAGMLQRQRAVE
jgi:hypothetical protein